MKRFTCVVLLLIFAGVAAYSQNPPAAPAAAAAAAQTTPPNPGTKFGALNFRTALLDSDAGKAAVKEIEKGLEPLKTSFEKLSKELGELQTKMQNAKTDAEKTPIARDIDAKTVEYKRVQEDAQRTSDEFQEKFLPPVAALINRIVDEYSKENNLAIVFDQTTDPSNIIFVNIASDITTEIIRRMNTAYAKDPKLTAPAAAAAAAAPAAAPKTNN